MLIRVNSGSTLIRQESARKICQPNRLGTREILRSCVPVVSVGMRAIF